MPLGAVHTIFPGCAGDREERDFQARLHSADRKSIARMTRERSLTHLMRRRKLMEWTPPNGIDVPKWRR
jgi:hypothetical protein